MGGWQLAAQGNPQPQQLPLWADTEPAAPVPAVRVGLAVPEARWVRDPADFARVLAQTEACPVVGLDTETTGLDPHTDRLRTVQIATATDVYVIDLAVAGPALPLRGWLAARAVAGRTTVLHNAKFDLKMLRQATGGAPLAQVAVSDLLLHSLVLGRGLTQSGGHGLAAVAERHLGLALPKEERRGDWSGELSAAQVAYAGRDAWALVPLRDALADGAWGQPGLTQCGLVATARLEDACVPAVADMEYAGIGFDLEYWRGMTAHLEQAVTDGARRVLEALGGARGPVERSLFGLEPRASLNLDSPAQLLLALRAAGIAAPATAERALRPFAADHPAITALLAYKRAAKLQSAFGAALPRHVHPRTGRIHAAYQQLNAGGIGRFSCGNPNVQQIPRDPAFRRGFCAPPGRRLVIADISQIELRVMCRLSGDARMLDAYRRGEDLHRLTAALLLRIPPDAVTPAQRQLAKAANFGLIYAMSAGGLRAYAASAFGVQLSRDEAETFRDRFFAAYPQVAAYHRRQDSVARQAGEVRTIIGRCRRFPDGQVGLPALVNYPNQGTGADILKRAMALLRPALVAAGAELVACVHDELVVECACAQGEAVRQAVQAALVQAGNDLLAPVPVQAEAVIGQSWADKA